MKKVFTLNEELTQKFFDGTGISVVFAVSSGGSNPERIYFKKENGDKLSIEKTATYSDQIKVGLISDKEYKEQWILEGEIVDVTKNFYEIFDEEHELDERLRTLRSRIEEGLLKLNKDKRRVLVPCKDTIKVDDGIPF